MVVTPVIVILTATTCDSTHVTSSLQYMYIVLKYVMGVSCLLKLQGHVHRTIRVRHTHTGMGDMSKHDTPITYFSTTCTQNNQSKTHPPRDGGYEQT